jgi:hypothetical protein
MAWTALETACEAAAHNYARVVALGDGTGPQLLEMPDRFRVRRRPIHQVKPDHDPLDLIQAWPPSRGTADKRDELPSLHALALGAGGVRAGSYPRSRSRPGDRATPPRAMPRNWPRGSEVTADDHPHHIIRPTGRFLGAQPACSERDATPALGSARAASGRGPKAPESRRGRAALDDPQ